MAVIINGKATVRLNLGASISVSPGFTGNRWYVSSSSTETESNGTLNTPWKSIAEVRSKIGNTIKPGDTVYFKRGDTFVGSFNFFSINGLPGRPYKFSAYGTGNKPKFTGTTSGTMNQLFYLQGSSYLVFDNLEITDTNINANDRTQLSRIQYAFKTDVNPSNTPTTNVTIQNCDISLVGIAAVFNPNSSYNTFTGCNVSNLRMIRNTDDSPLPPPGLDNDFGANGITVASSNNVITNNVFSGCWAQSFDYGYDGGGVEFFEDIGGIIENNLVAYNTFYDCNGTFELGSDSGGTIRNNIIAYNKIINCGSLFYISNGGIFSVNVSNLQFYNNVILQTAPKRSGTNATLMRTKVSQNTPNIITLKNNIFFAKQSETSIAAETRFNSTNLIASTNVYTLQSGSVMNFIRDTTDYFSTGSYTQYWTDQTDTDPLNWNYSPLVGSILINNGTNVNQTRDFANNPVSNPPEIGVLEYL